MAPAPAVSANYPLARCKKLRQINQRISRTVYFTSTALRRPPRTGGSHRARRGKRVRAGSLEQARLRGLIGASATRAGSSRQALARPRTRPHPPCARACDRLRVRACEAQNAHLPPFCERVRVCECKLAMYIFRYINFSKILPGHVTLGRRPTDPSQSPKLPNSIVYF